MTGEERFTDLCHRQVIPFKVNVSDLALTAFLSPLQRKLANNKESRCNEMLTGQSLIIFVS